MSDVRIWGPKQSPPQLLLTSSARQKSPFHGQCTLIHCPQELSQSYPCFSFGSWDHMARWWGNVICCFVWVNYSRVPCWKHWELLSEQSLSWHAGRDLPNAGGRAAFPRPSSLPSASLQPLSHSPSLMALAVLFGIIWIRKRQILGAL